jgi:hypothetical protein
MRRKIVIALLAFGTLGGFAAGFASLRCQRGSGHPGWQGRRAAFEQHVAAICADAALRMRAEGPRK